MRGSSWLVKMDERVPGVDARASGARRVWASRQEEGLRSYDGRFVVRSRGYKKYATMLRHSLCRDIAKVKMDDSRCCDNAVVVASWGLRWRLAMLRGCSYHSIIKVKWKGAAILQWFPYRRIVKYASPDFEKFLALATSLFENLFISPLAR